MTSKKQIIEKLKDTFEKHKSEIISTFYNSKENHYSAYGSLEEYSLKNIIDYKLIENTMNDKPFIMDCFVFKKCLESKKELIEINGMFYSIFEEIVKKTNIKTIEELIEKYTDHLEIIKEEILSNKKKITEHEFLKIFKIKEVFELNKSFIDELFQSAAILYCYKQFNSFINIIEQDLNENLLVYRAINIDNPESWLKSFLNGSEAIKNIGSSWSRSKKRAQPYESKYINGTTTVVLIATVSDENIDYKTTILKNISITYGDFEKELFLKENSVINIIEIMIFNNKKQHSIYVNLNKYI